MKAWTSFVVKDRGKLDFSVIFISISLVVYPATLLSVPKINGLIFALFSIAGLFFLFANRHKSAQNSRDEALFYSAVILFFFSTLLITMYGGFVYKVLGKYIHLLLAIPVYIYLRQSGVKLFSLWFGLVIGSIASAGVAIYDVWVLHIPRAQGFNNAIIFGNLSLVMGCMSMAGFGWFIQRANWQVIFPVFALTCGVLASVLSGTRGGWVAVPVIIVVLFWYIKPHFSLKQQSLAVMLLFVFLGAMYLLPQTGISNQIDRTVESIQQYTDTSEHSMRRVTSVSARLDMWQASWNMFIDNPILGVGWGHYAEQAKLQADQGLFNKKAILFDHPHSEYFSALANGGSLGFISLMLLFLIPAWLFIKTIKQGKSADTRRLALAGLVLVVSYMVFGLTEPMLYRSRSVNFFAFYLAVFMAAIYQENVVSR